MVENGHNITTHPWEKYYPKDIRWDTPLTAFPLYKLLEDTAKKIPDNPCIDFMGKIYTYREIQELVYKAAKGLQDLGVKKGTKVGLFLPNTPYNIIFYYAILRIGGIVVNYSPLYVKREIIPQIEDSQTEYLITLDLKVLYEKAYDLPQTTCLKKIIICSMANILPFAKSIAFRALKFGEIAKITVDESHYLSKDIFSNKGDFQEVSISVKDTAVLQYTGGTTGVPKAALLTHENLYTNTSQCALWCQEGLEFGEEKMMGILPLFHVFAMTVVMNVSIKIGALMILLPRFDIKSVFKTIHQKKPTVLPAVPTIFTALNNARSMENYDLSSLKLCISGGAPLPVEVQEKFEEKTKCKLVEGYGLSETSPIVTVNPFFTVNKTGSIGIPLPQTRVEIRDPDNQHQLLPVGQKGEVCVQGPQVMAGYWNRAEETAQAIQDGWFYTGDVGYMDEDGYFFIVDRIKDLVISGGYNIYPRQVEEAIYLHPDIAETSVIGVPHEYRGQVVKAFIVLKENVKLSERDILSFLKDKISQIEMPKFVEFRTELPKTLVGKIYKKKLIEEELAKKYV